MRLNLRAVIPALTLGAIIAMPSFATSVNGTANIAGTVDVTDTSIDFHNTFNAPNTTPPPTENGSFAGLTGGTIGNLTGGPVTGAISIPDFITFNVNSGLPTPIIFDLTLIEMSSGTQAGCVDTVGSVCRPFPNSPFTLLQNTSSVTANLALDGQAYTGTADSGSSLTNGVFTTQINLPGLSTISEVLSTLAASGVISGQSYSATFVANAPVPPAVPEPASLLLMGIGLFGAGIVARKKIRH